VLLRDEDRWARRRRHLPEGSRVTAKTCAGSRASADSEDSQGEGVDERGVAVVEALEGLTIAARDLLDQTGRVVPPLGTHANFVSQAARR
jgi:hypothetical protein